MEQKHVVSPRMFCERWMEKNLRSSIVLLYVKEACQVWSESFKRFSSNSGFSVCLQT